MKDGGPGHIKVVSVAVHVEAFDFRKHFYVCVCATRSARESCAELSASSKLDPQVRRGFLMIFILPFLNWRRSSVLWLVICPSTSLSIDSYMGKCTVEQMIKNYYEN